jgi:hypothetical protein
MGKSMTFQWEKKKTITLISSKTRGTLEMRWYYTMEENEKE